jgi:hypothetical protein
MSEGEVTFLIVIGVIALVAFLYLVARGDE